MYVNCKTRTTVLPAFDKFKCLLNQEDLHGLVHVFSYIGRLQPTELLLLQCIIFFDKQIFLIHVAINKVQCI